MEERAKLIWTIVAFLALLAIEGYLLYNRYDKTSKLRVEIDNLNTKNNALKADIAKIPDMNKQLHELAQNDAVFARMIPDEKEERGILDFIGLAQDATGAVFKSAKETAQRTRRRKGGETKDYEVHSYEVKLTGTLEQFTSFLNQFEYHGYTNDYMRFFSLPSFSVRQTSDDSLINDCVVQIDSYSMTATESAGKAKQN